MTRFLTNTAAVLVALMITATSLSAITQVPSEPQLVLIAAPVLA